MTKEEFLGLKSESIDMDCYKASQAHWDGIAKPLDGLGRFEDMIKKIAAITRNADIAIDKRAVIVMCADNGVVEEGISQSEHDVTTIVSENMAKGIASVCRMSRIAHADVIPVDIGIKDETSVPGLLKKKIAKGTANFAKQQAMTEDELLEALSTGINLVKELKNKGYKILATGEMGIGNTTTSSAIASVLLDVPVENVTGRGAGLSSDGVKKKISVIENAVKKYNLHKNDTWRTLQCVGGFDIAGLTGVFIGGALYHIPIVIDGVISAVAALAAERLIPGCHEYMLASHKGKEPACELILDELGVKAVIDGELALGEGTGAVLLFPLLDMALEVYHENTTFEDIKVSQYKRLK